MAIKALLFDLDGTLLDTLSDLAGSVNRALALHGFPTHPEESYKMRIGGGADTMIRMACPPQVPEEAAKKVYADFTAIYAAHACDRTVPYDGIDDMINALGEKKYRLAVITNKPDAAAQDVVGHYFPGNPFEVIFGARPDVPLKPAPGAGIHICEMLHIKPEEVAFVGDSGTDMAFARAVGFYPIGVTWGFRGIPELKSGGAAVLVDHPSEILTVLSESAAR